MHSTTCCGPRVKHMQPDTRSNKSRSVSKPAPCRSHGSVPATAAGNTSHTGRPSTSSRCRQRADRKDSVTSAIRRSSCSNSKGFAIARNRDRVSWARTIGCTSEVFPALGRASRPSMQGTRPACERRFLCMPNRSTSTTGVLRRQLPVHTDSSRHNADPHHRAEICFDLRSLRLLPAPRKGKRRDSPAVVTAAVTNRCPRRRPGFYRPATSSNAPAKSR